MEDEQEYIEPIDGDVEPKRGELKMVRVRRDGVDSIELRLWNGSEWIEFDQYLHPGGSDE